MDTADSDLMHHQYRLSVLQWNPGPARRNLTQIIAATCGRFHAVIPQEASDHVPQVSDQFIAYTGNTDLAIWLNKDTFEPDPMVLVFRKRYGLTRAAPLHATAATRCRGSSLLELLTWDPCQSSASATLHAYIYLSFVPAATCKYHLSGNTC